MWLSFCFFPFLSFFIHNDFTLPYPLIPLLITQRESIDYPQCSPITMQIQQNQLLPNHPSNAKASLSRGLAPSSFGNRFCSTTSSSTSSSSTWALCGHRIQSTELLSTLSFCFHFAHFPKRRKKSWKIKRRKDTTRKGVARARKVRWLQGEGHARGASVERGVGFSSLFLSLSYSLSFSPHTRCCRCRLEDKWCILQICITQKHKLCTLHRYII